MPFASKEKADYQDYHENDYNEVFIFVEAFLGNIFPFLFLLFVLMDKKSA